MSERVELSGELRAFAAVVAFAGGGDDHMTLGAVSDALFSMDRMQFRKLDPDLELADYDKVFSELSRAIAKYGRDFDIGAALSLVAAPKP